MQMNFRPRHLVARAGAGVRSALMVLGALLLLFRAAPAWAGMDEVFDALEKGSYATAYREILALAKTGDEEAQYNLGVIYSDGAGIPVDKVLAIKWFRVAADKDFAPAQFNLGIMYQNGDGVQRDNAEAVRWFLLASDLGFDEAQYRLGLAYVSGRGVPKNFVKAAIWYRRAAKQNMPKAQANLAVLYLEGAGVPKDLTESLMWTVLALKQTPPGSGRSRLEGLRKHLEGQMAPTEKTSAIAQANSWKPTTENPEFQIDRGETGSNK